MFASAKGKQQKYACSTATVVRNSVLMISHITFRDCRVHIFSDSLSRNSCIKYYETARGGGGGGFSREIGWGMCVTFPEITLFQTKICDFYYPISDLIKNLIPYFRSESLEPGA